MAFSGFRRPVAPMDDEVIERKAMLSQMKQPGEAAARRTFKGGSTPSATTPPAITEGNPQDGGMEKMPKVVSDDELNQLFKDRFVPPGGSAFDGSGYGTASGYLQGATKWLEPQVRAAKSEQEAKNLVQNYLQSIQPELEKRGAKVGKIKNEAITLDGREYDTFRDIGGASEAQMLELGLPSAGPAMGAGIGAMGMGGAAAPSAMSALAPTDMGTYDELQRRLMEILGGDRAFDREALLAQMKR